MENWIDIYGYERLYQVSDMGRIKSLVRPNRLTEKVLKPTTQSKGYLMVRLSFGNSIITGYSIHRLVAEHFIPNPLNLPEVNHLDFNKTNNCKTNLEWVTHISNVDHNTKRGLPRKLSMAQVDILRTYRDKIEKINNSITEQTLILQQLKIENVTFIKSLNVSQATISNILNNRIYKL